MPRFIFYLLVSLFNFCSVSLAREAPRSPYQPVPRLDTANPQVENRVTSAGNVSMNFTNYGIFGNDGPGQTGSDFDPCSPNNWAPQCEFPAGSDIQYLYEAGLWVGALIEEEGTLVPRVSVGVDGWQNPAIHEFYPGEGEENGIVEISRNPEYFGCSGLVTYDPDARGDQEFISKMQDTLRDPVWVRPDPEDTTHVPLGLEIEKTARIWASPSFGDFIIFDYKVTNISDQLLRNVYVGLYVDADVGSQFEFDRHVDDIAGFLETDPVTGDTVNIAWIADNDGRRSFLNEGPLEYPHVAGTFLLSDNVVRPISSFNWWVSNSNVNYDYGPAWRSHAEDGSPLSWTRMFGTPVGDEHKYQLMSNCEFDFWQVSVDELTTTGVPDAISRCDGTLQPWDTEDPTPLPSSIDIANGYDARYLISWGPLGIFDHTTPEGMDIYRLNPGETFEFSFAYVLGEYFHDPANPQPTAENIDSSLFDFTGLLRTAARARALYDTFYDLPIPGIVGQPQVSGSVGNWSLSWDAPDVGAIAGYNIFGTNLSGDSSRIQINSAPHPTTTIALPMAQTGEDWLFEIQALDQSGWEGAFIQLVLRIGAAAPIENVHAVTENGSVWLNWDPSPEADVATYQIVRQALDPSGSLSSPNVIFEDTFWSDVNRLRDNAPMLGYRNRYLISALNDLGVASRVVDTVAVIPIGGGGLVLVLDETDSLSGIDYQRGGVSDDSVRAAYESALQIATIPYDYMDLRNQAQPGMDYTLQDLLQYDVVIWHSENVGLPSANYLDRKQILSDYVSLGGKLLLMGRSFLARELGVNPDYSWPFTMLPFEYDSVLSRGTTVGPGRPQFIGATPADNVYMLEVHLDPARLAQPHYNGNTNLDYLPGVELVWPIQDSEEIVLYNAVMHPNDGSGMANQPCGVYSRGAIMLTWPLYFMQLEDASQLLNYCVMSLRAVDTRSPIVSMGVVQNPVQTSYLDVYVVANEELRTPIEIKIRDSQTNDTLLATHASGFSYHADYQLSASDNITMRCQATDLLGNAVEVEKAFGTHYVLPSSPGATLSLPGGSATLTLPDHAFSRAGYLLLNAKQDEAAITDQVAISPAEWEVNGTCELCMRSSLTIQALSNRSIVIKKLENGVWEEISVMPTVQGNMVCAAISQLGTYAAFEGASKLVPNSIVLHPAFPNPFNPATNITFDLPNSAIVNVSVYNVLGQQVKTLADGALTAGRHEVVWDGSGEDATQMSSGLYFARLVSNDVTLVTKLALIR